MVRKVGGYRDKSTHIPDSQDAADALKMGVTDPSQVMGREDGYSGGGSNSQGGGGILLLLIVGGVLLLYFIVYVVPFLLVGYFIYSRMSPENKIKIKRLGRVAVMLVAVIAIFSIVAYGVIVSFFPDYAYDVFGIVQFNEYETVEARKNIQHCDFQEGDAVEGSAKEMLKQADILFEANDFAHARLYYMQLLKSLTKNVDKSWMNYRMADIYRLCGRYGDALPYYRESAKAGNADAYAQLGMAYVTGEGAVQDRKKGVALLEKAVGLGSGLAHMVLGQAYLQGGLVDKNRDKAIAYFIEAAEIDYTAFDMMRASFCRRNAGGDRCRTLRAILPERNK